MKSSKLSIIVGLMAFVLLFGFADGISEEAGASNKTVDPGVFANSTSFVLNTNKIGFSDSPSLSISGVRDLDIPRNLALGNPAPNPFNPKILIPFTLARSAFVDLGIYDLRGRRVANLESGNLAPGSYQREWNGKNRDGRSVPTGIYFVRIKGDGVQETKKIMLIE